ncbi:MAG TPA: redoxin domain-containing protein, partial [Iamia sp.]|nr:redoxin domain-containing protein [Iamia sp.]
MAEAPAVVVPGLKVGDEAPDFTLPGIDGGVERSWTLSGLRGQPVVLVFYPGDGTPVCTEQLMTYTDEIASF